MTSLPTSGSPCFLSAQTVYTWNGGSGGWSNGALWNTGSAPNSGLDLGTLPAGYYYAVDTSRTGEVDLIVSTTAIVPEPSTWAAVLTGDGLLALALRRRARPLRNHTAR